MKLVMGEQQQLIESSVLSWLRDRYDFQKRSRSVSDPVGCLPEVWQQFAEMGWLGLPLPESAGGFGGGALETGLMMRAFGRHLVVEPFRACILLGARLLAYLGRPDQRDGWLPAVVAGWVRVALAHDEASLHEPWAPRGTRARRDDGGWTLRGAKLLVEGAPGAGVLLVSATAEGPDGRPLGQRVFVVPAGAQGLSQHVCQTADGGRAADLRLDDLRLPADAMLGQDEDACGTLHRIHAEAVIAACWEAAGAMTAAWEQTVDHVKQRTQFGQPLSNFQVVAHRLAEMSVCCEEALAICELAAMRIDRGDPDAQAMASMVKSKVGRCANFVSKEAVQLHGAMGVSEELPIASLFRKLTAFALQGGATAWHSGRYGLRMLASGAWRESRTLPDAGATAASVNSEGMNLGLDESIAAFRDEVRAFLREALDPELVRGQRLTTAMYPEPEVSGPWQEALARRGWLVPLWPAEWGGTGWTPVQRFVFETECALAGAPLVHPMGVRLVGPVILRFGTEDQKREYLPRILSGEDYWCQGFSEPGAGSDLAALKMRAVRDGDDYVLNGSKIWTTQAHHANRMFALVRTSNEGRKQEGISFLLIDMNTPGITVRPIMTIGGDHDVNEVFFENVRVAQANRVGAENAGWDCAKYLLEFERGAGIFSPRLRSQLKRIGEVLDVLRERGIEPGEGFVGRFGDVVADLDAFEMMELKMLGRLQPGQNPGPMSSMLKLRASRTRQSIGELGIEALGIESLRWQDRLPAASAGDELLATLLPDYLNSRAYTIFGGAAEVQLGIIARTVAGV